MSYPNATYAQAITYSRGTTKIEALMNRIGQVTERLSPDADLSTEEATLHLAHLNQGMRVAKRAFDANSRMLNSVDSLINQCF